MEIETEKTKQYNINVRLSEDLHKFVEEKSKETGNNKSHAIRAIIRAFMRG